ncbi:hypothetical protein [Myceligenerans crystallogenes]
MVERLTRRTLKIVEADLAPGLSGIWMRLERNDYIVVNNVHAITELHRRHIIAHELMHVVSAFEDPPRSPGITSCGDAATEQRVEALACELMIGLASVGGVGARLTAMEMYR